MLTRANRSGLRTLSPRRAPRRFRPKGWWSPGANCGTDGWTSGTPATT